jgi:sugar phosphate isomerase/epimerase
MKFAFSTLAAPKWDFDTLISKAREFGYDGLEVRGFLNETILTAANVFLTDPRKLSQMCQSGGIAVACLSSSITMAGRKRQDAQSARDLVRFIDAAEQLGCRFVKISDTQVRPGQSRAEAATALAQWLVPMGDYAADKNVTILIENLLSFRNAKELWVILETLNHPAVAACWDVFNAAVIGEWPSVSVPTLNSRIQFTQVKDAQLGSLGANFCKLGEGDVRLADFFKRLRGIGYDGWVSFEWEKAWLPNIAGEPEEMLPDALKKMRDWTKPQVEEEEGKDAKKANKKGGKPADKKAEAQPATVQ